VARLDETVMRSIHLHHDRILEMWSAEVFTHASARGLSKPECENLMPLYLRSLAEPGQGALGSPHSRRSELVEAHLVARLRQGFDLGEIMDEFALLGRCIAALWAAEPADGRPDPVGIERFYAELHNASTRAADVFQRHMLEDEQLQKRLARRLDDLGVRWMRSEVDEEDGCAAVLDILLDATGAAAATILLDEEPGGTRTVACAAGAPRAAAALEAFAAGLEDRTPPLGDGTVDSYDFEAPAPLRAVGLARVLVTRFAAGQDGSGALLLAMAQHRPFSSREIGRVEALAERLALHEDRLRTFAKLRSVVAALEAERTFRERFVALLAHDLRTPLSSAMGYAEILREAEPIMPPQQVGAKIVKVLARADAMVCDMLDASRIHGGELPPLDLEDCDLRAVVKDALDDLENTHHGRTLLEPGEPVEGRFGAKDLRRAVWNLALNGIKYGTDGAVVRVSVRREGEDAVIDVRNAGRAIASALRARLFEPFAQGENTAPPSPRPGWGLGLTLVRGAALAHGGTVTVDSDLAQGTVFTMRIPLSPRRPPRPLPS
jgi:signal transduction histidine kinase